MNEGNDMHDIREELFGRVQVARTGNHSPNPAHLHEPFEHEDSVMYQFCRGCGLVAEANEKIARRLANEAGTPFTDTIPSGLYLETDRCPFCAFGETVGVSINPIP